MKSLYPVAPDTGDQETRASYGYAGAAVDSNTAMTSAHLRGET